VFRNRRKKRDQSRGEIQLLSRYGCNIPIVEISKYLSRALRISIIVAVTFFQNVEVRSSKFCYHYKDSKKDTKFKKENPNKIIIDRAIDSNQEIRN